MYETMPFSPLAASATVSVGNASVDTALPGTPGPGQSCYLCNTGATLVYARFGAAGGTATLTDTPVPPNSQFAVFSIPDTVTNVQLIGAVVGPVTVTIQRGIGM